MMLKKLTVFILAAAFLLTTVFYFSTRQSAAVNTEMLDAAALLPDSDIVVTMDFDRTFNVAATNLLSQDAVKIQHLKDLMKTVEQQIGINLYQIRQIAAGFKLPPDASKDLMKEAEFTAIVRTNDSNADMLDNWSRRIDAIAAFKDEQSASKEYLDNFKNYRAFKFEKAAPEKIADATRQFQDALKKSQDIAAKLNALPKLAADAAAVSNLKAKNQMIADELNKVLIILKADTQMKTERETSIKLQNRWNAITIDDAQRTAKLAAVTKESKEISPAFEKKHANAEKIESLLAAMETSFVEELTPENNPAVRTNLELDATLGSLSKLPPTKAAKTAEINRLAESADVLHGNLQTIAASPDSTADFAAPIPANDARFDKPKSPGFYETLKKAEHAETVNGKRMLVIDTAKLDAAPDTETSVKEAKMEVKKDSMPNLAIGFLDDKTMVIGFEKTVAPFLKREAGYKNQKVLEMLGAAQNSLFAFVVSSKATNQMFAQIAKAGAKTAAPNVSESSFYDNLTKDISIYGSVNFDGDKATNDVSMSLGFYKEIVGNLPLPEMDAAKNPDADDTFDFAGYQVGKDIFYDLFNSFKAVQASMTFKFEKKKIAALVRSAPKIIASIKAKNSTAKDKIVSVAQAKPNKLESAADLLTAPQFYIDLAGLLTKSGEK